jgi:hypothetical protein
MRWSTDTKGEIYHKLSTIGLDARPTSRAAPLPTGVQTSQPLSWHQQSETAPRRLQKRLFLDKNKSPVPPFDTPAPHTLCLVLTERWRQIRAQMVRRDSSKSMPPPLPLCASSL